MAFSEIGRTASLAGWKETGSVTEPANSWPVTTRGIIGPATGMAKSWATGTSGFENWAGLNGGNKVNQSAH